MKIRIDRILPWLHFSGALLVVVLSALFSAVYSTLGQEISAGESPGFAWLRATITTGMGFGLVYLILVCWIQLRQMRQSSFADAIIAIDKKRDRVEISPGSPSQITGVSKRRINCFNVYWG